MLQNSTKRTFTTESERTISNFSLNACTDIVVVLPKSEY